jgi:hypothetical protein
VNNAFLHGDLNEEAGLYDHTTRLQQEVSTEYCLPAHKIPLWTQASKIQWFEKLTTFLLGLGFKQSYVDTSLFIIKHQGSITSLLVYVNDILLTCKDPTFLQHIQD